MASPPARRPGSHPTPGRALGLLLAGVGWAVLGNAAEESPPPAVPTDDVRVDLVFGASADLDLFVTDPMHEEVYFANSPSRLGGTFGTDRRCDDPEPRIETVRFAPAPPGKYRVSVDFPIRCDPDVDEAPYTVVFEANGRRRTVEGTAQFGRLEHIVVEFEVLAPGAGAPDGR